jgi:amidohydrolase
MNEHLADLKARALARIDELGDELSEFAADIHAHPELGFQEHRSARRLVEALRGYGFAVEPGTGGLETAFRAEHGGGGAPTIAILAEYDALPDIGHGCGHNLICTAALGAAAAIRSVAPELPGKLLVLGTPAEEGGGGKVLMARAGAFDEVDAAMMFHPAGRTIVSRPSKAMVRVTVEFFGKSAHASAAPDLGINALEAMIQLFVLVNGLRQHLKRDGVMHGVITDGGKAANVIPAYTSAQFSVRGNDFRYRDELVEKLRACAEAAALATGCSTKVTPGMGYDNIVANTTMAGAFARNLDQLGVTHAPPGQNARMGSTDMGDVSQIVPAIHPYVNIADSTVAGHTIEMAAAAGSPGGFAGMLTAARGLALTCLDLFYEPGLLDEAKREFEGQLVVGKVKGKGR